MQKEENQASSSYNNECFEIIDPVYLKLHSITFFRGDEAMITESFKKQSKVRMVGTYITIPDL
ncbi:hypothetical protein M8C21_021094, partial [Ambrosia artemisiifolia]